LTDIADALPALYPRVSGAALQIMAREGIEYSISFAT
jgi:hypothetical protein